VFLLHNNYYIMSGNEFQTPQSVQKPYSKGRRSFLLPTSTDASGNPVNKDLNWLLSSQDIVFAVKGLIRYISRLQLLSTLLPWNQVASWQIYVDSVNNNGISGSVTWCRTIGHRSRVTIRIASFSGGLEFEPRSQDRPSWCRFFVVFHSRSTNMPE
jgi:hypothetical protein